MRFGICRAKSVDRWHGIDADDTLTGCGGGDEETAAAAPAPAATILLPCRSRRRAPATAGSHHRHASSNAKLGCSDAVREWLTVR